MPFGYGHGRGRGGGGGRLIIGLIIALVGIVGYLRLPKFTNPETGETYRVAMSIDQEKQLGLQAAPEMAAKMGGALDPRHDPDAAMVSRVGHKMVESTNAGQSPYADNFHFYLLNDSKTVNAFALPGGQIFITRALFDRFETEAQLAGVLAHEIGHVIGQHSAQQMAKQRLGTAVATGAGVAASDRYGYGGIVAAQVANQMLQMRYGREDETQSDDIGLRYMTQAGYDPRAMIRVMEILREAGGGRSQPEWMSSHPLPDTRISEIKQRIAADYPNGVPETLTQGEPLRGGAIEVQGRVGRLR
ncbi:MAG TPA: M48 family metalloprotease [Tepidisphaeraceae bacterium]|nr:M48 family metalloprotease [Tepidisphaeraceae bacterium]